MFLDLHGEGTRRVVEVGHLAEDGAMKLMFSWAGFPHPEEGFAGADEMAAAAHQALGRTPEFQLVDVTVKGHAAAAGGSGPGWMAAHGLDLDGVRTEEPEASYLAVAAADLAAGGSTAPAALAGPLVTFKIDRHAQDEALLDVEGSCRWSRVPPDALPGGPPREILAAPSPYLEFAYETLRRGLSHAAG